MANLLERSSLVLTPTAYNNGEALCVKPSDGSGDFQFSRNSAATRVNAQGLVENVQILSSNLVHNGDFSEEGVQEVSNGSFSQEGVQLVTNGDFATDSDWGLQTGWSISGGSLNAVNTNGIAFQSSLGLVIGKTYKVSLNTSNYVSGSARLKLGGSAYQNISTTDSFQEFYFIPTSNTDNIIFSYLSTFTGSIDNVSVREVGQDWEIASGSGWSIGDSKLIGVNALNYSAYQNALISGKTYKITYEVKDYVSGTFGIRANTVGGITVAANGVYTDYIKSNGVTVYLMGFGTFNGSITNISVKEVGQNWTLGTGWEIGNSVATKSGPDLSYLTQSSLTSVVGKTYNVKASITNVTTGNVRIDNFTSGTTYTSDTEVDVIYTATTAGAFRFLGWSGFDGTITNISVLEITDDTNLPRINYENFSYQDALGSELVVNGDFDTDSDWVKGTGWTISGGTANAAIPVASGLTASVGALTIGTTYKLTYTISNYSAGNIVIQAGWQASGASRSANGTYTEYLVCAGDTYVAFLGTSSFIGSIDNVSVKEYSGQEVVPDSGCGSWLFEPQSTNLITQSELFSDASWANGGLTINNNASVSPEGVFNATKIIATTANSRHELKTNLATANGTDMVSCFVKKSGYNYVQIASWANPSSYVNFDLANGSVGSIGTTPPTNYGIKDYGNGWYRIYANVQASGGGLVGIGIVTSASSGWAQSFIGNGIDGIEIWGAQVEAGNISSYIPTSGSTVTRNQDVCTNGGSLATINSTEGTLYFELNKVDRHTSVRFIGISDNTAYTNRVQMVSFANSDLFRLEFVVGGTSLSIDYTENENTFKKYAITYDINFIKLYVNGTKIGQVANTIGLPLANTFNSFDFGRNGGGNPFYGKTKALAVWKEALSDSELQSLTTI